VPPIDSSASCASSTCATAARGNGLLKAPYWQLVDRVASKNHIIAAIREAEELGFVDCRRGGMRVATSYGLTWLPSHDGTPPSNRWRSYRNPNLPPWPEPKKKAQGKLNPKIPTGI
jgi:hypothetical protein